MPLILYHTPNDSLRKILIKLAFISSATFLFMTPSIPASDSLKLQHKIESLLGQGKIDDALQSMTPLTEKKNPQALFLTAHILLSTTLNHLNPTLGLKYLNEAVQQYYPPAIDELAGLYLSGEFFARDETKALKLYTSAAQYGYGPSQFNCGIMNQDGQGARQSLLQAYINLSLASLNIKDLGDMTQDAAQYRDQITPHLSPEERQAAAQEIHRRTLLTTPTSSAQNNSKKNT